MEKKYIYKDPSIKHVDHFSCTFKSLKVFGTNSPEEITQTGGRVLVSHRAQSSRVCLFYHLSCKYRLNMTNWGIMNGSCSWQTLYFVLFCHRKLVKPSSHSIGKPFRLFCWTRVPDVSRRSAKRTQGHHQICFCLSPHILQGASPTEREKKKIMDSKKYLFSKGDIILFLRGPGTSPFGSTKRILKPKNFHPKG